MFQTNPFAANNGLRVIGRTSQSITLTWRDEVENGGPDERPGTSASVERIENSISDSVKSVDSDERNDNWFHVQMKKGEGSSASTEKWESVYKGYGEQCVIEGLPPDSLYIFRMKRNGEPEWGSDVTASTETLPASVEDFNRALEMQSDYLVSRILKLTRPSHLKRIIKMRDRNGMTPLMVASKMGNVAIVEKLLALGSEVNAKSSGCQRTSLIFASMTSQMNVISVLEQNGADWTIRDKSGCSSMDYAINCDNLPLLKLAYSKFGKKVIDEPDSSGWTPLLRATIVSDNVDILKFLLRKGADINYDSKPDLKTPLMAAVLAKKLKFVKFLLANGANVFQENLNGNTCLQMAKGLQYRIREFRKEITELLVKHMKEKSEQDQDL